MIPKETLGSSRVQVNTSKAQWTCTFCGETCDWDAIHQCAPNDETGRGYRQFSTGATRDTAEGKIDPSRAIHPSVLRMFCDYMLAKAEMPDHVRSQDNWQRGIPPAELLASLSRHHLDIWSHLKGGPTTEEIDAALNGALFNVMALMLHHLRGTLE